MFADVGTKHRWVGLRIDDDDIGCSEFVHGIDGQVGRMTGAEAEEHESGHATTLARPASPDHNGSPTWASKRGNS